MLGFFRNRTDHGTGEVRCHSMAENEKSKVEQNKIGHHFKMTSHQASLEQEGERRKDPSGMEPSFSSSPEDLLDNFLQQEFQSVWERTVKSRIITVDLYNALKDEPTLKQLLSFITRDEYEPSVPLLISSTLEATTCTKEDLEKYAASERLYAESEDSLQLERKSYYALCLFTNCDEYKAAVYIPNTLLSSEGVDLIEPEMMAFSTPGEQPLIPLESFKQFASTILPQVYIPLVRCFDKSAARPANRFHATIFLSKLHSSAASKFYSVISRSKKTSQDTMKLLLSAIDVALMPEFIVDLVAPTTLLRHVHTFKEDLWKFAKSINKPEFCLMKYIVIQIEETEEEFLKIKLHELFGKLLEKLAFETVHGQFLLAVVAQDKFVLSHFLEAAFFAPPSGLQPSALSTISRLLFLARTEKLEEGQFSGYDSKNSFDQLMRGCENQFHAHQTLLFDTLLNHFYLRLLKKLAMVLEHILSKQTPKISSTCLEITTLVFKLYEAKVAKTSEQLGSMFSEQQLDNLSAEERNVFKLLENAFLRCPQASLFHQLFKQFFYTALLHDSKTDFSKTVLQKHKFLGKLVKVYSDMLDQQLPGSSLTAHILILLNYVRLKCDSLQKNSFLVQFLKSHTIYRAFLPRLIEETSLKLVPAFSEEQAQQLRIIEQARRTEYLTSTMNGKEQAARFYETGIGLGSQFAADLGFEGVLQVVAESAGDESPAPAKKGTKKKKRKKKKNK